LGLIGAGGEPLPELFKGPSLGGKPPKKFNFRNFKQGCLGGRKPRELGVKRGEFSFSQGKVAQGCLALFGIGARFI